MQPNNVVDDDHRDDIVDQIIRNELHNKILMIL